jgi:NADH-ubiquinone oxidoreductase chain 5
VIPVRYELNLFFESLFICKLYRYCKIFVLFLLFLSGFYFVLNDLIYFIEWDTITLNSRRVVMTFLFY